MVRQFKIVSILVEKYISFQLFGLIMGGDIDRAAIQEAFLRIKEDISRLSSEVERLKSRPQEDLSALISQVVKETLKNVKPDNGDRLVRMVNKKRRQLIQSRIISIAATGNQSLSDLKDMIVDSEKLCSKATFYRYIDRMKNRGMIDTMKINEEDIIIKAQ